MKQADVPIEQNSGALGRSSRYGRPGFLSGLRGRLVVAVVAAAALAWLLWAAFAAANPETRSQILDFRPVDDFRIEATLEVVADPRFVVDCTLRAQDADHLTTGVARVVSPAGPDERRVVRAVVKTRDRAVTVTVVGCRRRG